MYTHQIPISQNSQSWSIIDISNSMKVLEYCVYRTTCSNIRSFVPNRASSDHLPSVMNNNPDTPFHACYPTPTPCREIGYVICQTSHTLSVHELLRDNVASKGIDVIRDLLTGPSLFHPKNITEPTCPLTTSLNGRIEVRQGFLANLYSQHLVRSLDWQDARLVLSTSVSIFPVRYHATRHKHLNTFPRETPLCFLSSKVAYIIAEKRPVTF